MFIKGLRIYCKMSDKLIMYCGKAASILMPVLAFIVAFEVFARYLFDSPTIWAYDVSLFLFGYVAALGGAYAQQKKLHINVDILYVLVSPKVKHIFNIISYALAIFFLILMFYTSVEKFQDAMQNNLRAPSEWGPVVWHFWLMMCIASALFILQLVRDEIDQIYELITGVSLIEEEEK